MDEFELLGWLLDPSVPDHIRLAVCKEILERST